VSASPQVVAEALVAAQRWESARATLVQALTADPDDAALLGLMVRTQRALGDRQGALASSRHLLSLTPRDPYALRLGTLVLLDVGWVDEAIGLASRAVEQDPANAANHLALSRAWADSGRPEAVDRQLASAREAVLLSPNSIDAQLQIGTALAADGDAAAARAAYTEALRQDPGNTAALNNLAVLEMRSGSPAEAARHLAAALAANPNGATARRNLDLLVVGIAHRSARWQLLAPVPALVAAAAGSLAAARILGVVALIVVPLVGLSWWRALTPGQRRAVGGLTRRVRARTWAWPALAAALGLGAVAEVLVQPGAVTTLELAGYLLASMVLLMLRAAAATPRRVQRARAARRSSDLGRLLGDGR
jgi:tetratricopeptide (TPR) repeat protein